MPSIEQHPLNHEKLNFLNENNGYLEVIPGAESKTIGQLSSIDENEDEIWFLQCPKGTDITQLLNRKMKLPGRTNVDDMEAVAVESHTPVDHAFGYCTKKHRYNLRVLPVRGSIVMRKVLKAQDLLSIEEIKERCPENVRVPVPEKVTIRHPLFGTDYEDNININESLQEKLHETSRKSLEFSIEKHMRRKTRTSDANERTKKKTKKRPMENSSQMISPKKIKKEKSVLIPESEVAPELKWLHSL